MDFVKFVFTNLIYLFNKTLSFFEVLRNSKIAIVGRVSIDLILVNLMFCCCLKGDRVTQSVAWLSIRLLGKKHELDSFSLFLEQDTLGTAHIL